MLFRSVTALLNEGTALHGLGKFDDAISCYDRALSLDKKCAMALAYKGLSFGEQGLINDALDCFKKALDIDKDYDMAQISKDIAEKLLQESNQDSIRKNS